MVVPGHSGISILQKCASATLWLILANLFDGLGVQVLLLRYTSPLEATWPEQQRCESGCLSPPVVPVPLGYAGSHE